MEELAAELERVRTSRDTVAREKHLLERQLDKARGTDGAMDGAGDVTSASILADQKKRLEAEVKRLQERLDKESAARTAAELKQTQSTQQA